MSLVTEMALMNHRRTGNPYGLYMPSRLPETGGGESDWASTLTLGMFSLTYHQSQRDVDDQIMGSFWRKVKRKGLSAGLDYLTNNNLGREWHANMVRQGRLDPKRWEELSKMYDRYSYAGMFGIGRTLATHFDAAGNKIPVDKLTGLAEKPGVANLANWKRAIKENFDFAANKAANGPIQLNAKNVLQYTTMGNMFRRITKFFATGKGAGEAGLYGLSFAFMIANIGVVGKKQWDESTANGDGLLTKLFKTGVAVVKETVKSIAAFEIGGMAYTLGFALLSFNPITAFAGGMMAAAIAHTLAYRGLNGVVGESVQHADRTNPFYQGQQQT